MVGSMLALIPPEIQILPSLVHRARGSHLSLGASEMVEFQDAFLAIAGLLSRKLAQAARPAPVQTVSRYCRLR